MHLPIEIISVIMDYSDLYTKCQISQISKECYKRFKVPKTPEKQKEIYDDGRMGKMYSGMDIMVKTDSTGFVYGLSYFEIGYNINTFKVSIAKTFEFTKDIVMDRGKYRITGYYWNIYETLLSSIKINGELVSTLKFVPYLTLNESFKDYKHHETVKEIEEIPDGKYEILEVNNRNHMKCRYMIEIGTIEVKKGDNVSISVYNNVSKYFKDNIEFEGIRVLQLTEN